MSRHVWSMFCYSRKLHLYDCLYFSRLASLPWKTCADWGLYILGCHLLCSETSSGLTSVKAASASAGWWHSISLNLVIEPCCTVHCRRWWWPCLLIIQLPCVWMWAVIKLQQNSSNFNKWCILINIFLFLFKLFMKMHNCTLSLFEVTAFHMTRCIIF